ncbi:MAG: glycoside hydrolase family 9 protein [Deltaproteobacteria bacterium]|nr:glycoside hydrolase family 9 protein [Deltaproteobacteria bacterium]
MKIINLKKTANLFLAIYIIFSTMLYGCIMPPRGVKLTPVRELDNIAEYQIKVNQTGYFTNHKKIAVYSSTIQKPVEWSLISGDKTIANGTTTIFGSDRDSGDFVHIIDFSSVNKEGENFKIKIQSNNSRTFKIAANLYGELELDSLRYFYLNRSGIPLEMPYVENKSRKRPAGHLSDARASCEKNDGCTAKNINVAGGWYDAGDYGKYVVNGGFSVWMLMNAYEWISIRDKKETTWPSLNIPESKNGTPDILNEAKWEMEWILKMQVKDGPMEGMAYHRIRNSQFTALGKAPPSVNSDPPRYIRNPSTTATLNLAASAALCARVYKNYDEALSEKCEAAAVKAYGAAKQNPEVAPSGGLGHIPYGDTIAEDEFFWAAAELFVTTKNEKYLKDLKSSKFWNGFNTNAGGSTSAFNWADTSSLGNLTLSLHQETLSDEDAQLQREQIIKFADTLLELVNKQGYRYPLKQGRYQWGSNSFVLNNAIILALAYDFLQKEEYLEAVLTSMDYILGRNPVDFSYVSGYGSNALKYPHHRFYAPSYNQKLPFIPEGTISGGPNSTLADSFAKSYRAGCPAAKCYVDSIESFSTNEVAINWNAALAWVTVWINRTI